MKVFYQIFEEEQLLIQKVIGVFDLTEYRGYISTLINARGWSNVRKVITDFTELDIEEVLNHIEELNKIRADQIKISFHNVMLATEAVTTAVLLLYRETRQPKYKYSVCSTTDAVIANLNIALTVDQIQNRIDNLKYLYSSK